MGVNLKGQYPYSVIELETVGFGSKTRQTLAPSESAMTTSAKIYSVRHELKRSIARKRVNDGSQVEKQNSRQSTLSTVTWLADQATMGNELTVLPFVPWLGTRFSIAGGLGKSKPA
ncbi:hypothetical protein RRG08_051968 [Elysia crispata]|uniref:Uncharacterized protein n=1 Tax=Elysia crispata TaxID=231223 RepID=A0AAE0ZCC2_9GAST|nr:hypothetical protein RRG08_051968 [Elysia crispata]